MQHVNCTKKEEITFKGNQGNIHKQSSHRCTQIFMRSVCNFYNLNQISRKTIQRELSCSMQTDGQTDMRMLHFLQLCMPNKRSTSQSTDLCLLDFQKVQHMWRTVQIGSSFSSIQIIEGKCGSQTNAHFWMPKMFSVSKSKSSHCYACLRTIIHKFLCVGWCSELGFIQSWRR